MQVQSMFNIFVMLRGHRGVTQYNMQPTLFHVAHACRCSRKYCVNHNTGTCAVNT